MSGNEKEKALVNAAYNGELAKVKSLIDEGVDVNCFPVDLTPLMAAAWKGYQTDSAAIIELLIKHGADVNATDRYGSSAVRLAHRKGLTKIVDLLKAHGGKYLGA
ncbi:MAG: ankyrin repeat domain-containing protein [Oscillospiraceae bacterium]|nr:ankyrin repeat domain-containing protein [Oscillospiraceae bacterium]